MVDFCNEPVSGSVYIQNTDPKGHRIRIQIRRTFAGLNFPVPIIYMERNQKISFIVKFVIVVVQDGSGDEGVELREGKQDQTTPNVKKRHK